MARPPKLDDVLPTVPNYAEDLIARLGHARAIEILERGRLIWKELGEPLLVASYERAIAQAKIAKAKSAQDA
jgi:hypothetical protein